MADCQRVFLLLLSMLQAFYLIEGRNNADQHRPQSGGVGCYKCDSFNGSDKHCGDPFHPAYNMARYHARCEQGMEDRIGMFPARYCTKIKGTNLRTNVELIVRSCGMQDFDNTCGLFEFKNERYSGCLMSCTRDACNAAHSTTAETWRARVRVLMVVLGVIYFVLNRS